MKTIYSLLLMIIFISCREQEPAQTIEIGDKIPKECFFNPSNAIYKFKTLNKNDDILYNAIVEMVIDGQEKVSQEEMLSIRKFVNTLFTNKPQGVVEWNISDDDFCKITNLTTNLVHGDSYKTSIKVCNSVLNNDVIAIGSYYRRSFVNDKTFIDVTLDSKIIKTLDWVAYYEVREKLGKQEVDYHMKLKHLVSTDIFVSYHDFWKNTVRTKKINDTAFVYSGILNFSKNDFVDYKTVNTELIPHLKKWKEE